MSDLFKEILPDLNYKKENLIRNGEMSESDYTKHIFIVNRALSMNVDTVLYANEMNANYNLDPLLQYDYIINTLRKKKRYSKWAKSSSILDIEIVKEFYNYNEQRAREVLPLLSTEHLEEIKNKMSRGGKDEISKGRSRTDN